MMDDCIMDSKPFGYISADPAKGELNGWSQPSNYGVICRVTNYEESGSNLIIEVEAESAFSVQDVIQPVLPSNIDGERFPAVEELMEEAGNPDDGKLYLRADVEVLSPPDVDYDDVAFTTFLDLLIPARQILQMSSMYKGQILEFKKAEDYNTDEQIQPNLEGLLRVVLRLPFTTRYVIPDIFSSLLEICSNKVDEII